MKDEILVIRFKLPEITDLTTIDFICTVGYRRTSKKFSVLFSGSKGYLSHIEINCEGNQEFGQNRMFLDRMRNKNGTLKNILIEVYFSLESGVRVSNRIIKEQKIYEKLSSAASVMHVTDNSDDLPF